MQFFSSLFQLALLASSALATDFVVLVGKDGIQFQPNNIKAAVGDNIIYRFYNVHNVNQGEFNQPCQASPNGFHSSLINATATTVFPNQFVVRVNDTKPIWFFCGYKNHCQGGMVGAVNAPTSGNTLDAYTTASKNTKSSQLVAGVAGGRFVPILSSSNSTSNSTARPSASAFPSPQPFTGSAAGGLLASQNVIGLTVLVATTVATAMLMV